MNWHTLSIMRLEVLLTLLVLWELVADLSVKENKQLVVNLTILFFGIITLSGFIPSANATLFGSMYISDELRFLLKNILNLSTLIILMQSTGWLKKPENLSKTGAFYLLIFSTLIGMDFMISAGDFLMLYLGLELATLPLTILAAFDKKVRRSAEAGIKLMMSSAVSSAVMLFGLSLIYGVYGTLHFSEIALLRDTSTLSVLALVFFMAGFGF